MAIELEGKSLEHARVTELVAMTPDTDTFDPVPWLRETIKGGVVYRNIDTDSDNYGNISRIIRLYSANSDKIIGTNDILNEGDDNEVLRIGKYVIKVFNFPVMADGWERERKSGLSAARAAVWLELGLAQYQDLAIPIRTPHLHACFYAENPAIMPIWIMSYENGNVDPQIIDPDFLHKLQTLLNTAFRSMGGERFLETMQFNNTPGNWLVDRKPDGDVVGLIKTGGCIASHPICKELWQREEKLFRI